MTVHLCANLGESAPSLKVLWLALVAVRFLRLLPVTWSRGSALCVQLCCTEGSPFEKAMNVVMCVFVKSTMIETMVP